MVRARAENLKPKWKKMNRVEMAIVSSQSYACMTILRRFTLALFVFLMLVACNAARTTPIEALRGITAGATTRFVFRTSGSNAEAYLTRPAGSGPFPLMILLHGHTLGSIGGGESVVPEAEAFARHLCYAGLAVSLPGYGTTEVSPGGDPKNILNVTLNVVLDGVSLVKKLPWIDAKRLYLYGYSRGAFFAALLVNRIEEIKGVVLQSGAYDLNRFYWDEVWFRPMLNPSGDEDPKLISILPEVSTWHAPTLLLHGELDLLVFVQQAYLLRDALKATNIPYELVIYPYYGHVIPRENVEKEATAFLRETSGSACRGDAS